MKFTSVPRAKLGVPLSLPLFSLGPTELATLRLRGDRVEIVVKCIVGLFWGMHIQHGGKFVKKKKVPQCTLKTYSTGLPRNLKVANTACTQMRHSEQTKSDTDTPEKKNEVSTAALLHRVVFIDCAGLLVS